MAESKTPAPKKAKKTTAKTAKAKAPAASVEAADSSYAIIKSGGKQYRVSPGAKIRVDRVAANIGDTIELGDVLVAKGDGAEAAKLGTPTLAGAIVKAKVVAHRKDKKVITYKYKRTKGYHKKQGHRQERTELLIESISL